MSSGRTRTGLCRRAFEAGPIDLGATLDSGQAFRWERGPDGVWTGVVGRRWVGLRGLPGGGVEAWTPEEPGDWEWLVTYLGLDVDLGTVVASFPPDEVLVAAAGRWPGLRLLRQDPWECLASFILSSTKQIVQIRAIVAEVCRRFGEPVAVPPGEPAAWSFPGPEVVARISEKDLRSCRMGFRAPYLKGAAGMIAAGEVDLQRARAASLEEARAELVRLPGVGPKIADCALLFSCGFTQAFPVDVWILRVLRDLYFGGREVGMDRLRTFAASHFGPHAGHAQQFLFHWVRTQAGRTG